jgi:hypothetical protein
LANDPEIQTGEGYAVGDFQSAIAFTAQVTREYFERHYPGDLDTCINHGIVARHVLKITFTIEAALVGGHAGADDGLHPGKGPSPVGTRGNTLPRTAMMWCIPESTG